jgi:predicted ATPase/DNA-binding SARP family transcriptional activator
VARPADANGQDGEVVDRPTDDAPARLAAVRVLGPLEIEATHGPVELRHGRPRALFLALLSRAGEAVSAELLIDQLWPADRPVSAANSLQVQVSYLRGRLRGLDGVRVEREGAGYRLVLDLDRVDARRFERTVEEVARALPRPGSAGRAVALLTSLDDALADWRGEPFTDADQLPLVEADVARLVELRLIAHEQRAELLARLGRHAENVAFLQPLVQEHPLRERLWALLVTALYRSGRQAEALRAYGAARDLLVDELGIDPGPELRSLERAVLDQDDDVLGWTPLAGVDAVDTGPTGADAAPPAPPAARRRRIPASISPLIGRRWEVDEVRSLVHRHRLVTLIGPGGVGKTRLAYEAAGGIPVPVAVAELASVDDPEALPSLVAASVPVTTVAGGDPLDAVADRIGEDEWILVLDNCEHLVDAAASVASTLLRQCPGLRVLATSRQLLGVAGELIWLVPFLEVPDEGSARPTDVAAATAVRLFVDRAQATNPHFEIDDHNAAAVAAICRSLDGLPLAIELAAARAGLLSPEAILERLHDRFALLSRGGGDASARQRSLQATVDWSFELLAGDERRFFAALGVFAGTFDLPAAQFVAGTGTDAEALDLLAGLVDRSLVVSCGGDRYRLLDTLRAYALGRLSDGPEPALESVRRRHAEWFLALAVSADPHAHGPLPDGWPRLRAEAANLRAALTWAFGPTGDPAIGARMVGAVAGSLVLEGATAELDTWLARADAAGGDHVTRATVLRGIAVVALYQARFDAALVAAEAGVASAEATGDDVLVASCLLAMGSAQWGTGDLDRSVALLRRAAGLFDRAGDVRGRGFALARLARSLTDLNDPAAVETATAAVDDLEASREDWMGVVALDHLAYALLADGDLEAADARAEQAVALADRIGSSSGRLAALGLLGRIRLAGGHLPAAAAAHVEAVSLAVRIRNPGSVVDNLRSLAEVRRRDGAPGDAALLLGCADAVGQRSAPPGTGRRAAAATHGDRVRDRDRDELGDGEPINGADLDEAVAAGRRLAPLDAIAAVGPTTGTGPEHTAPAEPTSVATEVTGTVPG